MKQLRIVSSWSESMDAALVHRPDWHDQAACRDEPNGMFFPPEDNRELVMRAKEVCADCPVRAVCLNYALESPEEFGIWGGKTSAERRQMSGHPMWHRYRSRNRD